MQTGTGKALRSSLEKGFGFFHLKINNICVQGAHEMKFNLHFAAWVLPKQAKCCPVAGLGTGQGCNPLIPISAVPGSRGKRGAQCLWQRLPPGLWSCMKAGTLAMPLHHSQTEVTPLGHPL